MEFYIGTQCARKCCGVSKSLALQKKNMYLFLLALKHIVEFLKFLIFQIFALK